jgi:YidC/Oxa1 family membrane protein insertase
MNTRLIIAVIISVLLMLLYQNFFMKKPPQEIPKGKEVVSAEKAGEKAKVAEELSREIRVEQRPKEGVTYQDVVINTPLYTATFTTYGGRLKSWRLKGYMDKVPLHPVGKFVQNLVSGVLGGKKVEDTPPQPVDIVNTKGMENSPLGISFREGGIGYDERIPFVPSAEGVSLTREGEKKTLAFRWRSPHRGEIDKELTFYADSYRMDMEIVVSNPTNRTPLKDSLELDWTAEAEEGKGQYGFFGPIYYSDGAFQKIKPKKVGGEGTIVQKIDWFGMERGYFIALILPSMQGTSLDLKRSPENVILNAQLTPVEMKPGGSERIVYTLFLGPKIAKLLGAITPTAEKTAGYGWLTFIAVPIVKALTFTNRFTGNYGIDIIILAVFLKIIFTPLTHKSQEQMKEMQKLQPEIKRLQEKYKDDKQALNREVMELYKRRKVNPLGGCLPMLVQLPVFFALYRAFYDAIQLRHSPFILWIRDLADKDPTYITPLLMGATMYFQQKMTAVSGDPAQMRMMSFMPIFFTFIFLSFPSGLVLYWLVTNVLAIGHQFYINRKK